MAAHIKRNFLLITLVFFVWLAIFITFFTVTDVNSAVTSAVNININYLILAICTFVLSLVVSAINWNLMIRFIHKKISFFTTFQIMLAGYSIDNILPNLAPGGAVRMAYL